MAPPMGFTSKGRMLLDYETERHKFYCLRQGTSKRGEGPKHALHRIFDLFGWPKYQKNQFQKFLFLSCRGLKTA